jgi:hypothetical protein
MRLPLSASLCACSLLIASSARAVSPSACADAAFRGQTLRNEDKLLEAREEFRACVVEECPSFVQKDCATWLEDVETRLPSVVLSAKDPSGQDLTDVKVTVDGGLLTAKLDGQSLPMNPGPHTFVFERDDGGSAKADVVLVEAETARRISVVVAAPLEPAPAAPPPVAEGRARGWRVAGYAVAGAGVVGLGIGAVFGALSIAEKSSAHCNQNGVCSNAGSLADLRRSSSIATASLVSGGVLFAGGAALVLLAPEGRPARGPTIQMAPVIGTKVAGFVLEANF